MVSKVETVLFRTQGGAEFKREHDAHKAEAKELLATVLLSVLSGYGCDCAEKAADILEDETKRNMLRDAAVQYADGLHIQAEYNRK